MEDSEAIYPSLFCKEDESCLGEQYLQKDEIFEVFSVSESDCEYTEMLMQRETHFQSKGNGSSWLKCARADIIKWVIDTTMLFGFRLRTAYLSLIYFDRFCSRRSIDDGKLWTVRLLSVACLSLAAKLEENEVPALSEYHIDEYNFKGNVIQKMELLVLNILGWNLSCVTPFSYLNYFIAKFFVEIRRSELLTYAGELVFAVIEEINVAEHRPSIIAAAAVLAAYDHQLTKEVLETKTNTIPSWTSLEKEQTSSCYNLMQEAIAESIISLNLSVDASTITYVGGTKRKLSYRDSDQHCPAKKLSKP